MGAPHRRLRREGAPHVGRQPSREAAVLAVRLQFPARAGGCGERGAEEEQGEEGEEEEAPGSKQGCTGLPWPWP